jgi:arylsulfatase A-like enzyme
MSLAGLVSDAHVRFCARFFEGTFMSTCFRYWIFVTIVYSLLAGVSFGAQDEPTRRPNILFLLADEMRADCLGVAGHAMVKTPNLDRLAQRGVRFTHAYAASPVCSPDRAVLFTGRYPHVNGVELNGQKFAEGEVALPQLLRRHGYATAMSGKLHLHHTPDWFDEEWIVAGGKRGNPYTDYIREKVPGLKGGPRVAAKPGTLITYGESFPLRIGTSVLPDELYEEAWVADRAIEFLLKQKRGDKPWFLFVSMLKPHSPFVVPEPYASMYDPKKIALPETFDPKAQPPAHLRRARHFINDPEVLRQVAAHYYGAVTMVDRHMGRVLKALEEFGFADNTIVLFTADHGNMLGERNRMFKGCMYSSSVRVPQLLYAPDAVEGSKVCDYVHDHTAIMPTLLDLAGLPIPEGMQNQSLRPSIRGGDTSGGTAFAELHERMVATADWKLIAPYKKQGEAYGLYHLAKDPHEQNNLYDKPEAAAVQKRLMEAMEHRWAQKPPSVKLPELKD